MSSEAAPSGPTSSPPDLDSVEGLRAELEKVKATTAQWKRSVKEQLLDAQAKNKTLREERDTIRGQLGELEGSIRLRLEREFAERLEMKESEVVRVSQDLAAARQQRVADAQEHARALAHVRKEAAAKHDEDSAAAAEQVRRLQRTHDDAVAELRKSLAETEHDLSVARAKGTTLEGRLRDATATAAAASTQQQSMVDAGTVAALKKDLETAQHEAAAARGAADALRRQADEAVERARASMEDRFRGDVQQRDDQINVLQVLLRQSQQEAWSVQQQVSVIQGRLDGEADIREAKLAEVRASLAAAIRRADDATAESSRLRAESQALVARVRALDEEREAREEAFARIYLSDTHKETVRELQSQVDASQARYQAAADELARLRASLNAERSAMAASAAAQTQAQMAVSDRQRAIDEKMNRLAAQEQRIREQTEQLSRYAEHVRASSGAVHTHPGSTTAASSAANAAGRAAPAAVTVDAVGRIHGVSSANARGVMGAASDLLEMASTAIRRGRVQQGYQRLSQLNTRTMIIGAVALLLTFSYLWVLSGGTSRDARDSMNALTAMDALAALKNQYNALATQYAVCCPQSPPMQPLQNTFPKA